jgi:hypothetical protein
MVATENSAHGSSDVSSAIGVVGRRVPHALFGEPKDVLLRLRYEGRYSHVHADVRTSQVREPLLGQFVPEEKT